MKDIRQEKTRLDKDTKNRKGDRIVQEEDKTGQERCGNKIETGVKFVLGFVCRYFLTLFFSCGNKLFHFFSIQKKFSSQSKGQLFYLKQ